MNEDSFQVFIKFMHTDNHGMTIIVESGLKHKHFTFVPCKDSNFEFLVIGKEVLSEGKTDLSCSSTVHVVLTHVLAHLMK